jgi:hypothetical protein
MPVAEADAKIDMLQAGQRLARFDLIKPCVHRYSRYLVRGDHRRLLDLWTRRVSFEIGDGQSVLHFRQRCDAADGFYVAVLDQTPEPRTSRL